MSASSDDHPDADPSHEQEITLFPLIGFAT
jgi:hypothetical protein